MKYAQVYSIEEVKENFTKAFEKLLENWQEEQWETGGAWADETIYSMVKVIEGLGLKVKNYYIDWGWDDGSWVDVTGLEDDEGGLTREEAKKWIEERVPETHDFTGFYADEVFVSTLKEGVEKHTLHHTITRVLPKVAAQLIQEDVKELCNEERFIEICNLNSWYFLPDGHKVKEAVTII